METKFRQAGLLPPEKLGGYLQPYEHDWHGKTDAANVVGFLPGTDPVLRGEVVIVSAHHDHLGRNTGSGCPDGRHGDRIHPGANDNASGSAAMLELAFALSSRANELKRTVLFLSVDGEECGCTGAKHYVYEDPVFALEDTVYVLNIDQIGEDAWLEKHRKPRRVDHGADCEVDGEVFARRGIKAATLVGHNSHYHSPEDTVGHMDFPEAMKVVDRALELVWNAAQAPSDQAAVTRGEP
ncbi:M28 family metallopeptidase [Paracoccus benzoatiresistens]|uniref:M28 family peptidase n=1 Tax=Paracoccus benzoatiresistens TaxID=2997341 RepID=A0ABT4JCJ5_9RHOB|nr:M28 family peptidase [Paracoccus sp. EF6]MCZ0964302.1 M28 family peptidase [Paracoccus sp. EF6]